jgi:bis(5'-adenosyl)-triphosphatase
MGKDGAAAGQTVPHVHVHVIPRKKGDYLNNDDIYKDINQAEKHYGPDHEERSARTQEDMAQESSVLRNYFH